ncbi:uncharacterized protein [Aquarana catesbeiana]|uniref:uncharacterized protein n=1 Tax=Aquarana catesbeiana TaxID=8400 RepID=UPI003CCA42C5
MDYLWRFFIISVLIAECFGDNQAVRPTSATMQITTTPQCVNCPKKTTTRHTTTHSTLLTSHTTTAPTTAHTSHTTEPPTTAHTNHTTEPPTTAHTNHTTEPPTTAHANHTTEPPTTAHTNHTSTADPTTHTNHTTTPHTSAHTNHTTAPHTSAHTNHTTAPHTSAHTNHTTAPHTSAHTNHTTQASTTSPRKHTSTPHTNQTTPPHTTPSPLPPPTEYFVNGTSEVCLRIKAVFMLKLNNTKFPNYTIPSPPTTKASGSCSPDTAELILAFPKGSLALTFKKDTKKSSFYLAIINVTVSGEGISKVSLDGISTPLGHSFTCKEVDFEVSSSVKLALKDVQAQAIELKGGNFGPEMNCSSSSSHSKTVPIVVGVILLVLIIVVVAAYLIARKLRHRSDGYQPL